MKTLELNQMESIEGGDCQGASISWGITAIGFGLAVVTGGLAAVALGGIGFVVGMMNTAESCFPLSTSN